MLSRPTALMIALRVNIKLFQIEASACDSPELDQTIETTLRANKIRFWPADVSTIAGSACDCVLVHRHLPVASSFVMTKYIQAPIAPPDLEVTIAGAMPLIDVLSDLDLAAIETNSAELLDAVLVHMGLRPDLYGVLFHHIRIG